MSMTGNGRESAIDPGPRTFDQLRDELRIALLHLYDPLFRPPSGLCEMLGCSPDQGCGTLQTNLVSAIQDMEPGPGVPADSRVRRYFDFLHERFVLGLSQEETAAKLSISVRHVQRVQSEAIHYLAQRLWNLNLIADGIDTLQGQAPDWLAQTERELLSLRTSDPDAVANVSETLNEILELGEILASQHDIKIALGRLQPDMSAGIHPAVLRQMIITALGQIMRHMLSGSLGIYASLEGGEVKITLSGSADLGAISRTHEIVGGIIRPAGTYVDAHVSKSHLFVQIRVPSMGQRTVVVVEDNSDIVHFYRRCTAGTTYRIVHAAPAQDLFTLVDNAAPDIIVLDIMLPNIDGWQLLTHLHARSATRTIPVIVCSVVREEELAFALGAAGFLSKPVQAQRFVEALDQAFLLGTGGVPTSPGHSATLS